MKAARNVIKHNVRFTEAATVFFDERAIFEVDYDHSEEENHYIVLGRSIRSNITLVVHVFRGEKIRILSAKIATVRERKLYEETGRRR